MCSLPNRNAASSPCGLTAEPFEWRSTMTRS
jgi:hypothetical protein